jgi:hypothetical protein
MYEFYDRYTKISWYCNTSPLNNILILCTLNNNNNNNKRRKKSLKSQIIIQIHYIKHKKVILPCP